jgi:pantothenate kinase-related protein Tda10
MNRKWTVLDLIISAMEKLSPKTGERQNVLAFIQSCYGGRVRYYDLDRAVVSLFKLTPEEQNCLITWTLQEKELRSHLGTTAAA